MPELRRLLLADDPGAWARAGFSVDPTPPTTEPAEVPTPLPAEPPDHDRGYRIVIGSVVVAFVGSGADRGGAAAWELAVEEPAVDSPDTRDSIDGIATTTVALARRSEPSPPEAGGHPNGVVRVDHVVVTTPDLDRTISALEDHGFELRRRRDVPGSSPPRRQAFLWAGEPILEVVGPSGPAARPRADEPARIWGLALTTDDLDRAATRLGPVLGPPRPAVQPGRRIATIDTRGLGIGLGLALMTPHRADRPARERGTATDQ